MGAAAPVTRAERRMLEAVPHRHTHRGPFEPGSLPGGLLAGLQHDALAEGAELALVEGELAYQRLATIVAVAASRMDLDPRARAETRQWTRGAESRARDGIPAMAFADRAQRRPRRRLPQRDFDLDRGLALLPGGGEPPPATAVLLTRGDRRAGWLPAGQALHRLLLHATSKWVFASLYTQPLEATVTRTLIRDRLALPGKPSAADAIRLCPHDAPHRTPSGRRGAQYLGSGSLGGLTTWRRNSPAPPVIPAAFGYLYRHGGRR